MQQITIKISVTEDELKFIEQWNSLVPKLILLDNCVVTDINNKVYINDNINELKLSIFDFLRRRDKSFNIVSLLLVILEKLSNTHTKKSEAEIISSILDYDIPNLKSFLKHARISESEDFLNAILAIIPEFKKIDLDYKNFLNALNYKLELYNNISEFPENAEGRIEMVGKILNFADENSIKRDDLIVLICISKVYRLPAAQAVLKLTPSITKFNTSNALGDILSFQRVNFIKGEMQRIPQLRDKEVIFLTSDEGLFELNKVIKFTQFKAKNRDLGEYTHSFEFHHRYVLYCLFNENGEIKQECIKEAIDIYNMLGLDIKSFL